MYEGTYKVKNGHLHHTLIEVCWLVLHDLYGHDLVRLHILAFNDLTKCALTENVENKVSTCVMNGPSRLAIKKDTLIAIFTSEPIIYVEDIVKIFVVVPVIVHWFAGLGKNPARIVGRFISKTRIAYTISVHNVGRKLSKRLCKKGVRYEWAVSRQGKTY